MDRLEINSNLHRNLIFYLFFFLPLVQVELTNLQIHVYLHELYRYIIQMQYKYTLRFDECKTNPKFAYHDAYEFESYIQTYMIP